MLGFTFEEFQSEVVNFNLPKFRARQILDWIYKKNTLDFDKMRNIPLDERNVLKQNFSLSRLDIINKSVSKNDGSIKYLFALNDTNRIESVKIFGKERITLCISSQVGCSYNCSFCATGKMGFVRNLETGEIIGQILSCIENNENITNIVFMGMGEPLSNYDNVLKTIKIINSKEALNFGARRITISTCGLPDQIRKLIKEGIQVNLAVSLNSADDKIRSKLMPINNKYNIKSVISAVKDYIKTTNRRVTFEYVLLKGINDGIYDAKKLVNILKGLICNVNLIMFNSIGDKYRSTDKDKAIEFIKILKHGGLTATIRKSAGSDIAAACGQLAVL